MFTIPPDQDSTQATAPGGALLAAHWREPAILADEPGAKERDLASKKDEFGIPCKGSALQAAYYVNCDPESLNAPIRRALGLPNIRIKWKSPVAATTLKEYSDAAFLQSLGRDDLAAALSRYWPSGGSVWDALAQIGKKRWGVLLVEAKANVPEMVSPPDGCQAGKGTSREPASANALENRDQIASALRQTREALGVPESAADTWLSSHCYQHANRLAHLHFFRLRGEHAWLINLYFTNDTTHAPTDKAAFERQRRLDKTAMGLDGRDLPGSVAVYVPAKPDAYKLLRAHIENGASWQEA
jgi:hypothetical protein